ncbi:MAG: CbiX/SirB N-terminal domain-containing protein [Candidatus Scalindua sp.]|nr:CbiX/SirB N-terminal domain-containing protein [Candidatus Scalindua sp.]
MKALLLVAHGSRRQQSNDEVVLLADKLRKKCFAQYNIVHAAFLELAEVLIPDGIRKCIDEGASSVVVLPYFLNSGRHVVDDIPNIVKDTMKYYPDVDIRIAPHLGASDLMLELLIASADSTRPC